MSEGMDEADAQDSDVWHRGISGEYILSRYRRRSGARRKTRDLLSYIAYRVDMAYPFWSQEAQFRRLPPPIRALLTIRIAVALVGNGGVEFLLSGGLPPGCRFGEIVRDFRLAGTKDIAERLAEVLRLFPGGMPQRCGGARELTLWQLDQDVLNRASEAIRTNSSAASRAAATRVRLAPHLLRPVTAVLFPPALDHTTHYQPL